MSNLYNNNLTPWYIRNFERNLQKDGGHKIFRNGEKIRLKEKVQNYGEVGRSIE